MEDKIKQHRIMAVQRFKNYVVATINVKEQKLKLFLGKIQVDELSYKLR